MLKAKLANYNIILGSKSPRRKELLAGLDIPFTTKTKETDESFSKDMDIRDVAEYLAIKKANAFDSELESSDLLITSDTTVCLKDQILNKAQNKDEAIAMLKSLSDQTHEVITGVCIKTSEKTISFSETTKVYFKQLEDEEIEYYVDNYQPFDKAGAYGIQEWIGYIGVKKIEGDYYNVMGLPLFKLFKQLESF